MTVELLSENRMTSGVGELVAIADQQSETIQSETIKTLAIREQYRDHYWERRVPIAAERLLWRAQTFRHMVHLLPGQTILELGSGKGLFTRQLAHVSRGKNQITSVTFNP